MLSLRGKWNAKVAKGTKLQSKDTHLPPALYRRVLHGDRCASETLQGVHISRASWIAAWNVRATHLAIISMKKKKKRKKSERLRFVQNRHQLARNSVTRYLVAWMVFFRVKNFEQISISFRGLQWLLLPYLIKYIFSPVIVIGKTCCFYSRTI